MLQLRMPGWVTKQFLLHNSDLFQNNKLSTTTEEKVEVCTGNPKHGPYPHCIFRAN